MAYYEILIPLQTPQSDALIPYLEELGCNGYLESDAGLYAYIEENFIDEEKLHNLLTNTFHVPQPAYSKTLLPDKNWNRESELNFDPRVIDDKILIRAPFHNISKEYPYDIIIEPAMAFGTGHHETTANMIRLQLETEMSNARVFDYGTGTGILAILAENQGSQSITASEIQQDALINTRKNIELNHCQSIHLTSQTIGQINDQTNEPFDVILANITRNTIIDSLPTINNLLVKDGVLIVSGYYRQDQELLNEAMSSHGYDLVKPLSEGKWGAAKYHKVV